MAGHDGTEFRLLGPFEVRQSGRSLDVGAGKQRALLALLLLNVGEAVSTDRVIDALWGERPPASALNSVRVYVSHLRKALGSERLVTRGRGYLLDAEPDELDLARFERLATDGRNALAAGDAERAAKLLRTALALWRGRPLDDFASEPFAQTEIARLEELRLIAVEERVEADLALGRHAELVADLDALVRSNPLRERLRAQLMLALYRSGRQAEALEAYRQTRTTLVAELGLEPGRRLQELERAILSQDPRLDAPAQTAAARRARGRGGLLIATGAALLFAAALAVVVIEYGGGDDPGLTAAAANAVALIDAGTNRLVADVPVGNGPTSIAVGRGAAWVTNVQDDSVSRIDLRSKTVVDRIPVGSAPSGIAVVAGAVWAANSQESTVMRIDPQTNDVVDTIAVGVTPTGVAGGRGAVWVSSADGRSVTKIGVTNGRAETIKTGAVARGVAVGGGGVWLTDESKGTVVRIDPARGSVVHTVSVGRGPTGIAFGAGSVWVANSLDGTVSRVDPATNAVTATIPVGEGPNGIAVAPDAVWVSVEFSGLIVRIDPAENRVVERIPVENRPKGIAVSDDQVWFASQSSGAGHRGGRLVVAHLFGSIDPVFAHPTTLSTLYDGLVGVARVGGSEGGRIVPNLATSMPEITAGGMRYAFRLRGGVRYSNGRLVRAGDFRRALERLFRARAPNVSSFESLVGSGACETRPRTCDLSRGVRADDASGTIVFRLRRPDAEFLFTLVSLAPVPSGTPDGDTGRRPVPSTGPYRVASLVPGRKLVLVRNPHFRVRSRAARPDGFPDEIEFRNAPTEAAAVTAVERQEADVALPIEQTERLRVGYASQLHLHPQQATFFVFLNTRLSPFDDVRVRRALNYAVDRAAAARSEGGSELAQATCQLIPPGVVGRRPYCPYTVAPTPTGEWKAPDLATARRLVAASRTGGMRVTVWTFPLAEPATRHVVAALRRLGYRASLMRHPGGPAYFAKVRDERTRAQAGLWGWFGYAGTSGSSFLPTLTCSSIRRGGQNQNPSFFCDPKIDARIARALELQATDPYAPADLWVQIERELVDRAPWVPLFTPQAATFVSKRVGNYQYNPVWGVLLDQLWVR